MDALLVKSKHHGPFYYYVYTLLHAMAPWSILFPIAVLEAARRARTRTGWGFALVWLSTSFLVLSLLSSKQIHYALLLVAPGSLLIGAAIHSGRRSARRWAGGTSWAIALLLAAGGVALLGAIGLRLRPIPLVPAGLCLVALALALSACRRACLIEHRLIRIAFALAALLPAGLQVAESISGRVTAVRWVTRTAVQTISTGTAVTCVGPKSDTVDFYANRPRRFAPSLAEAWATAIPGSLVVATWDLKDRPAVSSFPAPPLVEGADASTFAAAFMKPDAP
jgi:4-amino-4-deoxy-L-arabinose transferase-like glycosyltransferase